jgi:hypothetical protein
MKASVAIMKELDKVVDIHEREAYDELLRDRLDVR